ncbi:AraC family transcriptional regulator [Chryseobacterium sp. BIGb0232]|uniref:helix-turn-helix domain-containing protein n=1 Tax=Chryseobacterium sp. BIGb0232 TaxID=2940598 RepID=UPI000F4984F7|nr:helix-turn-helix domain-containing protein [Chryseobacterium sp. BIGb0232]MCS4301225.1 AraC-like DNA-binding protein [Chryseobacterium sp. BIGb0232]ROS19915.1 AraC-like DNA-binding protein [Chryseobacterium nakagawai]
MKQAIPTYDLNDISQHGILVERMEQRDHKSEDMLLDKGIHRDNNYIFTCMESGHVKMMVDFKTVESQDPAIFCVLPGQVHQGLMMKDVSGWFVAVKAELIPETVRSVFEELLVEIQPLSVSKSWREKINTSASLLKFFLSDEILGSKEGSLIVQSQLHALTGMFAFIYKHENRVKTAHEPRALQLTRAFRTLVRAEFKTMKSPSAYAALLNISRGYLTEVIREVTGKSAQHWIHQEILIESKRLLVFTHLTIKEIAYEIGYNDHTYFSRLFSKLEGQPPSEFRDKNR